MSETFIPNYASEQRILHTDDFQGIAPSRADEWTNVARHQVYDGQRLILPAAQPYKLNLCARVTRAGANAGAAAAVTLGNGTLEDFVQTPRYQAQLPYAYHADVVVWCKVAGVWQRADITAIDHPNEALTYTEPANTTDVVIEYAHGNGLMRLSVARSSGFSSQESDVFLGDLSIGALNRRDQDDIESRPLTRARVELVTGFSIVLAIKSPHLHVFDELSLSFMEFIGAQQSIRELDKAALRATVSAQSSVRY